ncbi:MAG: dephospho-CoA kinase [Arcicella sp.]|nr:dephospho-CoA kinase [Arcicella sp.]
MKLIGITGGIGSGKSIVCKVFAAMGVPIYEADSRAKYLMNNDLSLKKSIQNLLGEQAYIPTGEYNRVWVASQVFNNPELLKQLNTIVHPRVREDAENWIQKHSKAPFLLYEAALMKAAGDGNNFNKVIVVKSPIDLRIKRVQRRDNRSEQEIRDIIARQISDEERLKIADFVIENDEVQPLLEQILDIEKVLI